MSAENILEALTDNIVVDKSKCIFCGHCAEKCVLDNIRINRAPCSGACPLGLNVQGYVQLIARGQEDRARQLIADVLPFAPVICRICDHPCEHACNRRDVDGQAVSINGLKRYLFAGMPDGELCPAAATGKKVAIVGAGPAGMLAAYDLRRAGHDVAVYDAAPKAGGLLRSVLPLWKLPDSVLDGQIAMLEKGGVTFHLGQRIDKAGLEALQAAHDAVILALGAGEGRASGISGEQLPGTLQALDFLTRVRSGHGRELSGNVVIVGGGYVALDCAQAAVRCGAEKVLVVYRRTVDDFKADREDLEKARALGVRFAFTWAPERITDAGGLTLYCRHDMAKLPGQCVDYPDFDPDEERAFPADTIIWAIGQQPDRQLASLAGGVSVDPVTLQAGEKPLFVAGDMVGGASSAIRAMASGRQAATSVLRLLEGSDLYYERSYPGPFIDDYVLDIAEPCRHERQQGSGHVCTGKGDFAETTDVFTAEQARTEASRCLSCGGPTGHYRNCWFCLPCEVECPEQALYVNIPYLLR